MAQGMYVGVGDKARKIANAYVGVDGIARRIVAAYVGDENGKARKFYQAEEEIYLSDPTVSINDGILSWDDIEGAEWYDIYVTKYDSEGNEEEIFVASYPVEDQAFGRHVVRVQNYSGDERKMRLVARSESDPTTVVTSEPDPISEENDYISLGYGEEKEVVIKNGQELQFVTINGSLSNEYVTGNGNIDNENDELYIGHTDMNDVNLIDTGDIRWTYGGL